MNLLPDWIWKRVAFLNRPSHSAKTKSAIILTTHELKRAYQIADYFLVVKNGKQIFFGARNEIPIEIEEFYRSLTA